MQYAKALLFLLPLTFASPLSLISRGDKLVTRQSCVDTCGSVCYWQSDIDDALQKGYSLEQSGGKAGTGSGAYPHEYENYEGFDLPVSGPYYEFPILNTFKVYTGGEPGPDRVVFNSRGQFADLVTHTGASGNDFVECKKD
ncbi:MAG: hypothetical protein Q9227_005289 [Pyrenula ochraceoflavens]